LLDRRLKARGFYPQEVVRLKSTLAIDSLYFVSLLPWHNVENPYTIQYITEFKNLAAIAKTWPHDEFRTYANFSFKRYTACQIDYSIYRTAHVLPGRRCRFVGPDMKEVNCLLGQHTIPVLSGKKIVDSNGVVTLSFDVMV
jgi:hypothetical protein